MTCHTCGASKATIHVNRILNGAADTRDYCTKCFAASEFFDASVLAGARAFDSQRLKAEFETNIRQLEAALGDKLKDVFEKNPRYRRDACAFLFQGLHYASTKEACGAPCSRHVSARQLVEACEACAKEMYGASAQEQLKSWGLQTAADVGDLVFLLIENGILGKNQDDNRSDFEHLPFLND